MAAYRGVSISPLHGSFAQGYEPKPSDLENLVAGRERELTDFVNQSEFESLLSGEINVFRSTSGEKIGRDSRALSQNGLSSRLVLQGSVKSGL